MAFKSDFIYIFLQVSAYVYSPGQGQTIHWGQNFDDNRKAFSLCPYVASFKMISSKSDFIHIFNLNDFIHVYSPWAREENPLGQTFDVNRKPLSLRPFVASFNSSHAVRGLSRVRQYPPWLLFATFVEFVGYPRYNPQKTRKQWRTRDRRFHWLWGWFPDLKIIFMM